MSISQDLLNRSGNKCELCGSIENLATYTVSPRDEEIVVCSTCLEQLEDNSKIDENHWFCLNDSMWSEVDAVKVVAYRMFHLLKNQDMIDMMYLEDDVKQWADAGIVSSDDNGTVVKDANGATLEEGDTVTLIKDLEVKGAGFTAKRGTVVKNIHMCDVDGHIEGKVNGTKIYLKTCFLKKA